MKIDLHLDATDAAVAELAARYGRDYASDERRRRPWPQRRFDAQAWRAIADMGWLAVATPEEQGGLGGHAGAIAALARQAGASGITEPWASGVLAALLLQAAGSPPADALASLAEGRSCWALSFAGRGDAPLAWVDGRLHGRREAVADADLASQLLIERDDGQGWWLLEASTSASAPGLTRRPLPLLDGRGAATLDLAGAAAMPLVGVVPVLAACAALIAAADALGAMETAFALTLEHVKTRQQFGTAIGHNQVVAHRTVDMYLRVQEARAVLARAVRALGPAPGLGVGVGVGPDGGRPARWAEVHAAAAFTGRHARGVVQEAVQLHGGIGITEEYGVSHCLRRVLVDEHWAGAPDAQLQAFAHPAH
ncbi:MAG: acyl-CoA/acyl-ACP dehydrogenase [Burkholderiaceae bacterium]|nr:acyl-CoA/acyl-ACP dehydrogenase [Burkholderiaceae bacterium]